MSVVRECQKRLSFTPDYGELVRRENVLLFVYDDFMRNHSKNVLLFKKNAKYLGLGRTTTPYFRMRCIDKDNIPIAFDCLGKSNQPLQAHIQGEVYAVKPEVITEIDEYFGNQVTVHRKTRSVTLIDQYHDNVAKFPRVSCFMYLGDEEYWSSMTTIPNHIIRSNVTQKSYYKWG